MAYIPPDAKWYIADVVMQIRVDGDPRTLVHINTLLVRADSPDEAYEKALDLGRGQDSIYENPEGREVSITFRGLQDLNVIHDPLEHGAELCYAERPIFRIRRRQNWSRPATSSGCSDLANARRGWTTCRRTSRTNFGPPALTKFEPVLRSEFQV